LYNIEIKLEETPGIQISSMCANQKAFLDFKRTSTIDRLLKSYHRFDFKIPKVQPKDYVGNDVKLKFPKKRILTKNKTFNQEAKPQSPIQSQRIQPPETVNLPSRILNRSMIISDFSSISKSRKSRHPFDLTGN
jgi:hypothetical protein